MCNSGISHLKAAHAVNVLCVVLDIDFFKHHQNLILGITSRKFSSDKQFLQIFTKICSWMNELKIFGGKRKILENFSLT